MRRRDFLGGLCIAATAWSAGQAQQIKVPRLGILLVGNREPFFRHFTEGLHEAGYVDGQNIQLIVRSAQGRLSALPDLAAELVGLNVDVIVASETPAVQAAKRATSQIPIVMTASDRYRRKQHLSRSLAGKADP